METRPEAGGGRGSCHGCQRCQSVRGPLSRDDLFALFEVMLLKLKHRLGITADVVRANHTNLE